MDASLKAHIAQLGPVRAVKLVSTGSPTPFVLHLPRGHAVPKTVDAAMTLARRGLSMLAAKRTMEELLRAHRVLVLLPMVEDAAMLTAELAECGVAAAPVDQPSATDVCALRP